ncbi:MAG: protein kinase [Proteobacteria bacterium]|nr:protein kinase [Pseudomonadota bacterium]
MVILPAGGALLEPGDQIDIWVVEQALGQGGMGSVYRCHNKNAQRIKAAIKVLDPSLNRIATAQARFIREAEILFALEHPNIVKVRNVRMDAELPYLEMEFVEGKNLEDRIFDGALDFDDALPLLKQAASALKYMHDCGIRHRDIKPSNIILQSDGTLKLVDFGIATEQDGKTITESGQNFGSVSYAPPEWIEPDDLDPVKWDVYSLGVVFYELLTGRFGFPISGIGTSRQKALQVMIAKQSHPPLDPGGHLPVDLRTLVRAMTRSDPAERMSDAEAICTYLDELDLERVDDDASFADEPEFRPTAPTWYPGIEGTGETMVPDSEALEAAAAEILAGAKKKKVEPDPAKAQKKTEPAPVSPVVEKKVEPAPPPPPVADPVPEPAGSKAPLIATAVVLLGLAGGAAWWFTQEPPVEAPTDRDVAVIVTGVAADVPLTVTLDGTPGTANGTKWGFDATALGPHKVQVVVGEDCTDEAAWCGRFDQKVVVARGDGAQTETVAVTAPTARDVVVSAPGVKRKATLKLAGQEVELAKGEGTVTAVLPGRYEGVLDAGADQAKQELIVPWGDGPVTWELDIELAAEVKTSGGGGTTTDTTPTAATTAAKSPVSNASFSAWLGSHADWQRDAAIEASKADGNYLKGWDGATPPAGKESQAIVNVSWSAANAYCSGRGGLAALDAAPTTWSESSSSPWHEYRQNDGKPAWRRSDGGVSTNVGRSDTRAFIGFRCAK